MKQTKRRMEVLNFFDHTGIEAHLEKMARKGWLIQRISSLVWVYRRIQPKKIHFCISYYPRASEFDPEPQPDQQEFLEFCRHTGWTLACTSAQMQIFYNEREDPVPIETDPMLEVETIHAAVKRNYMIGNGLLLAVGLFNGFVFLMSLFGNLVATLSNPSQLLSGMCWALVVILTTTDFATYFRWRKKALEAAENGIFLDTYNTVKLQKAALVVLAVVFGSYLLTMFQSADNRMKVGMVLMCIYMVLLFAGVDGVKRLMKRWKVSRNVNRAVTCGTAFLLAFGMNMVVTLGIMEMDEAGLFDQQKETYSYGGMTWEVHHDEIPLRVEDLMAVDYPYYSTENDADRTIFLSRERIRQDARMGPEHADIPQLRYNIVTVKMPFLFERCVKEMLEEFGRYSDDGYYTVQQTDPAPWGADAAWGIHCEEGWIMNHFLLCYGSRIVEIWFDWEVNSEQMTVVGQCLG